MTEIEFNKKVNLNTEEYHRQIKENSFDVKKFFGFDTDCKDLGRWELAKKTHDILGAVVLGMLPILKKKTGFDAMKIVNGNFVGVELKSSYTDESKFIRTAKNAIYSATTDRVINGKINKGSTTSFKSNFNATYSIVENLGAKNIDTYLIIADSRTDEIVDCFFISGNIMEIYLNERKIPDSGAVQIKLSTFEKLGTQYIDTIVPVIGLEKWKNSLLPLLPIVHVVNSKRAHPLIEPSPMTRLGKYSRIDPSSKMSILYTQDHDQQQIPDFEGIQPTFLSSIS